MHDVFWITVIVTVEIAVMGVVLKLWLRYVLPWQTKGDQ